MIYKHKQTYRIKKMVETINGVLCVSVPEASEKSYELLIGVYTLIIILTVFLY